MGRTGSKDTVERVHSDDESLCSNCGDVFEGVSESESIHDAWVGRVLDGRYVLERRVGAGASGAVYLARDAVLCDRVAVKIVDVEDAPSSKAARSRLERVQREVQAAASLSHPHLVRFVDFVELSRTHAAIVTDFVDGETLEQIIDREGPLDVERAVEIASQVAMAIGAMHSRHIVHRDLKPANIIVQQLPGQGDFCQIIDFGIVRYEDEVARTNAFLGTPMYASPEQVTGGLVDHRVDVYGLGIILFEMLTGRTPFEADTAFEALRSHARLEPPTLADAAPESSFPVGMQALIDDMLEKSPDSRIQTMTEVVRRLKQARLRQPELASLDADGEAETLVYLDGEHTVFERRDCKHSHARPIWDVRGEVTALAVGHRAVIAGTRQGTIEQFERPEGVSQTLFTAPHREPVTSVAIAKDGSIVAGYASGRVYLTYRSEAGGRWVRLPGGAPVKSVAISSISGAVLVSREDQTTEVYVLDRSLTRPTLRLEHESAVQSIDFSGDGFLIGVKGVRGGLQIYSIANGVLLTSQTACPYSASPDRAACPNHDACPMAVFNSA